MVVEILANRQGNKNLKVRIDGHKMKKVVTALKKVLEKRNMF